MKGGNPESLARGHTLMRAGYVERGCGNLERARDLSLAALSIARKHGDSYVTVSCLMILGIVAMWRALYTEGDTYLQETLALARSAELPAFEGLTLSNLGWLASRRGDYDATHEWCRLALAVARPVGDAWSIAVALTVLADALIQQDQLAAARAHLEEALVLRLQLGESVGTARTLAQLGRLAYAEGRVREARSLLADALRLRREVGDQIGVVESLEAIAEVGAAAGHMERPLHLLGAAAAERRRLGAPLSPLDRARLEAWLPRVTAVLGVERLAQATAIGEAMLIDEACAFALAEVDGVAGSSPGAAGCAANRKVGPLGTQALLSPREREVAVLVAQGRSNREIGSALVIAARTADTHVGHILTKLNLHTRAQIAGWVVERGLAKAPTTS